MPSLIMKTKLSTGSIREKSCLGLCQKSSLISKKTCSHIKVSQQTSKLDMFIQKFQGDYGSSNTQFCNGEIGSDEAVNQQEFSNDGYSPFQKQPCMIADPAGMERMEGMNSSLSDLETIFSPALEPFEFSNVQNIDDNAGSNKDLFVPGLGADDSDDNTSPQGYQAYNVSDFFISDMIIASLPFDGNMFDDNLPEMNPFPDYKCAEPSMLFDVAEECMALPFLEDTAKGSNSNDIEPCEEAMIEANNGSIYLAINQIQSCNQVSDINTDSDQADDFDPQLFIKNLPELSDVVSNFHPIILQESLGRKSVTLVLDLDETLVHSTLDYCGDADFTFNVFFNMREHTVYVRQRPHLQTFLERVAEMFEVVIFTASQSIYAEQLLDTLDPERKIISRRVYRESCIFSDGSYTKDLTVLGVDLAKVAIIDNSPQVFRLQVNNGIPIKSWFSDPSDCALISLLPFLETLVDADDVRPIIAKRFGNKE